MAGYENFAYFYHKLTDRAEYEKRSEYLYNLLSEKNISEGILLDVACGTGALSELMSEKGFDVIGTDISADMLSIAMENGSGNVQYLCQDMSQLDLFGTVNAVICTMDSINHVTDEEKVREAFKRIGLFTEKGGYFIFDVNTLYKHRKILGGNTFVYDTGEVYCVWLNELDEDGSTVHISLDLFAEKENNTYERYCEDFDEVVYSDKWLIDALENAGFTVEGIYKDLTKEPCDENTERKIFVCKKNVQTNGYYNEKE